MPFDFDGYGAPGGKCEALRREERLTGAGDSRKGLAGDLYTKSWPSPDRRSTIVVIMKLTTIILAVALYDCLVEHSLWSMAVCLVGAVWLNLDE
jgi:hypothetical protein